MRPRDGGMEERQKEEGDIAKLDKHERGWEGKLRLYEKQKEKEKAGN